MAGTSGTHVLVREHDLVIVIYCTIDDRVDSTTFLQSAYITHLLSYLIHNEYQQCGYRSKPRLASM